MSRGALARWQGEVGDGHALAAARVVVGVLLGLDTARAARELTQGYFADVFHWPMLPPGLEPPRTGYVALLACRGALALLAVVGWRAREALAGSALLGAYVLLCDRLQLHNNRWALCCDALLLSLTPCEGAWTLRRPPPPARGPLWAARLLGAQVSLVYLASGGSKLLDPDWRGGQVLLERFHLYAGQALSAGVPAWLLEALAQPLATSGMARAAIATELGLAVALWWPRTRAAALWVGVWFHLVIEATARVEGFSWLTLAAYAAFVTPDVRARRLLFDATSRGGRVCARAVRALDWLARFEVSPGTPPVAGAARVAAVDRGGAIATGLGALTVLARALPLLFPLWVPLAALSALRGRGAQPGTTSGAGARPRSRSATT